jgi:hypothetical protein
MAITFYSGVEVRITPLVSDRYPWFSYKSVIVIGTRAIVIGARAIVIGNQSLDCQVRLITLRKLIHININ